MKRAYKPRFKVGQRIVAIPRSDFAGQKGTIIRVPKTSSDVYWVKFDEGFIGHKLEHYMLPAAPRRRKTAIFYLSQRPGPGRQPLYLNGRVSAVGFIRIQLFNGSLSQALVKATPEKDETVMNTHKVAL